MKQSPLLALAGSGWALTVPVPVFGRATKQVKNPVKIDPRKRPTPCGLTVRSWRRGSESNRRMQLLQSRALPLGYPAIHAPTTLLNCSPVASKKTPTSQPASYCPGQTPPQFFVLQRAIHPEGPPRTSRRSNGCRGLPAPPVSTGNPSRPAKRCLLDSACDHGCNFPRQRCVQRSAHLPIDSPSRSPSRSRGHSERSS